MFTACLSRVPPRFLGRVHERVVVLGVQIPDKMKHVICTGNLCTKEQLEDLKVLAPKVHVARGDFDEDSSLPETKVVTIGSFRIGICHGHQVVPWGHPESLAMLARQLNVDILITGHTHKNKVMKYEGKHFINPGSITGAYSGVTECVYVCVCGPACRA